LSGGRDEDAPGAEAVQEHPQVFQEDQVPRTVSSSQRKDR